VVDVKTITLSGTVTLDGKVPTTGTCASPTDVKARILLGDAARHLQQNIDIPCSATDYAFSGSVLPGTYSLWLEGLGAATSLLATPYRIDPARVFATSASGLVLDVKGPVPVSGTVTLNGGAPAGCAQGAAPGISKANVRFTNKATGVVVDVALLCGAPDFSYKTSLYPGTYSVQVESAGGADVPQPLPPTLVFSSLSVAAPQSGLTLAVKTVPVTGTVTLNGGAPTDCPAGASTADVKAYVRFDAVGASFQTASPRLALPCGTKGYGFSGTIPAGIYKVTVGAGVTGDSNLPAIEYVVNPSLAVSASPTNVAADVKAYPVSGTITLDGVKPTDGAGCAGNPTFLKVRVVFTDVATKGAAGFDVPCSAADYAFSATLPPGTYKVSVFGVTPQTNLPTDTFIVPSRVVVSGATSGLVIPARSKVPISGKVTLNGATPMDSGTCTGQKVAIRWTETGSGVIQGSFPVPCGAADYAFSGALFPGTYEVVISGLAGTTLPQHGYVFSTDLVVSAAATNQVLDVKTVPVSGTVTLNGAPPTDGAGCSGNPLGSKATLVFLSQYEAERAALPPTMPPNLLGTRLGIACSSPYAFSGDLYPGTYSIAVVGTANASNLPLNGSPYMVPSIARIAIP
jgi:hypothetical protein